MLLRNPEAEEFFLDLYAHDGVGTALIESLKQLEHYELRGDLQSYRAPYAVTSDVVFCGASDMVNTYWRLAPEACAAAIASGGASVDLGPEWVKIVLFRSGQPKPDLLHWARSSYEFARKRE
jgi:hypothetical protein